MYLAKKLYNFLITLEVGKRILMLCKNVNKFEQFLKERLRKTEKENFIVLTVTNF